MDFSDAWAAGIKIKFPTALIIICYFHVVQLLVRALTAEFERVKKLKFTGFISECNDARNNSLSVEKGENIARKPKSAHQFIIAWLEIQEKIFDLCRINDPETFTIALDSLFEEIQSWNTGIGEEFEASLEKKKPKKGFTIKGIMYYKKELNKKWRGVIRGFRKELEAQKREFHEMKYILLKKSCNISSFEEARLMPYIEAHPWLLPYRIAIVGFYWVLEDPWKYGASLEFLNALVTPESHKSLKAAVRTLGERHEEIFNFMRVVEHDPSLKLHPGFRVNPEPPMRKVNDISRVQFGIRSDASVALRVGQAFGCPIKLSDALPTA